MWSVRFWIVPVVLAVHLSAAQAGIFSRRSGPPPNPAEHVPALLRTLQGDPDERKRAAAAEELREYDTRQFPQIVPALIEALAKDPSSSVRSEAAQALGRLRPISQPAGYALEQALQNDSSMRVRWAARTALWQYHFMGYRGGRPDPATKPETDEPPLAAPLTGGPAMRPPVRGPAPMPPTLPIRQTDEPPLAVPAPLPEAPAAPPVKVSPTLPPPVPPLPIPLSPAPTPPQGEAGEGPELNPPG